LTGSKPVFISLDFFIYGCLIVYVVFVVFKPLWRNFGVEGCDLGEKNIIDAQSEVEVNFNEGPNFVDKLI